MAIHMSLFDPKDTGRLTYRGLPLHVKTSETTPLGLILLPDAAEALHDLQPSSETLSVIIEKWDTISHGLTLCSNDTDLCWQAWSIIKGCDIVPLALGSIKPDSEVRLNTHASRACGLPVLQGRLLLGIGLAMGQVWQVMPIALDRRVGRSPSISDRDTATKLAEAMFAILETWEVVHEASYELCKEAGTYAESFQAYVLLIQPFSVAIPASILFLEDKLINL